MKPLDLIQLYAVFKDAMAGTSIPTELKAQVAKEVLDSLPPTAFCAACPATREWIGQAIQATVDDLKPKHDRTNTEAAQTAQAETKTVRPRKASKESLG